MRISVSLSRHEFGKEAYFWSYMSVVMLNDICIRITPLGITYYLNIILTAIASLKADSILVTFEDTSTMCISYKHDMYI